MTRRPESRPVSGTSALAAPDPADRFSPADWARCVNEAVRRALDRAFDRAHAHEGTLWMADSRVRALVPIYNNGPHAARFVGRFKQPFSSGLISMVLACEQAFIENDAPVNRRHSRRLDRHLNVQTQALLAVPFYVRDICRGVVSCVQLRSSSASGGIRPAGFKPEDLEQLERGAAQAGDLIGHRLERSRPTKGESASA